MPVGFLFLPLVVVGGLGARRSLLLAGSGLCVGIAATLVLMVVTPSCSGMPCPPALSGRQIPVALALATIGAVLALAARRPRPDGRAAAARPGRSRGAVGRDRV